MKKILSLRICFLLIVFVLLKVDNTFAIDNFYVSNEVAGDPRTARVRNNVENLKNEWIRDLRSINTCINEIKVADYTNAEIVSKGKGKDNTVSFLIGDIKTMIINLDFDQDFKIDNLLDLGGGKLELSRAVGLQENSPRPSSSYKGSESDYFINDLLGGSKKSRNAFLIRFDRPVRAFGAWFGDLETNSLVQNAEYYLYDEFNNIIEEGVVESDPSIRQEKDCTRAFSGCGNKTTRFIGFIKEQAIVKQLLIVVGGDSIGNDGKLEHLSIVAPLIADKFICDGSDLNEEEDPIDVVGPITEVPDEVVEEGPQCIITNYENLNKEFAESILSTISLAEQSFRKYRKAANKNICKNIKKKRTKKFKARFNEIKARTNRSLAVLPSETRECISLKGLSCKTIYPEVVFKNIFKEIDQLDTEINKLAKNCKKKARKNIETGFNIRFNEAMVEFSKYPRQYLSCREF